MEGELCRQSSVLYLYLGGYMIYIYIIYIPPYIYHTKLGGEFLAVSGHMGWINGVSNDMTRLKTSQFNRERRGNHIRGVYS